MATLVEPSRLLRRTVHVPDAPVVMVIPPSGFLLDERVFMSLGILKVAAVLEKAGGRVEMLDLSGISNYVDAVLAHMAWSKAKHVCLTATTPQMPAVAKIVEALRAVRSDVVIVLGGPHPTLTYAAKKLEQKGGRIARAHRAMEVLHRLADVVVAGDGELAIAHAIAPEAPRVIDADDRQSSLFLSNADYEETPMPARHLIDVASYHYAIDGHRAASLVAQLGCPYGCNFSLTGDTLITTDRGFERLDTLLEGVGRVERCVHGGQVRVHALDRVVATHDGQWSRGVEVVDEGERTVFEVGTENGIRLKATAEHRFLVVDGESTVWRRTDEIQIGDWMVMRNPDRQWPTEYVKLEAPTKLPVIPPGGFARKSTHVSPTQLTPDVAWLAGFIVGDGCLPMDGRPSVHIAVTPAVRKKLLRVVKEAFHVDLSVRPASNTKKMEHGWIHSRLVYAFFTETLGMQPGDKLHIPSAIVRSPRDVLQAFVDGLFDADSYASPKGDILSTKSGTLAREVAHAMLLLGQIPTVQRIDRSKYNLPPDHRVSTLHNDRIPTKRALYCSPKSGKWHWRTPRQPKTFLGIRRRTLNESGLPHPLNVPGQYYVRVEHIVASVPARVYDLRVPEKHSFLADGLVSHNCGGRNSAMLRKIRMRSTASILAELEHLHRDYGFTGFMFSDDELNVSRSCVELMKGIAALAKRLGTEFRLRGFVKSEIFTAEQAETMYAAGFRWLLCGFEAADERILENINKKATIEDNTRVVELCNQHGLKVKALMSVGHAGESEKSILAVRDWLVRVKPADFDCTVISTYPGTPYYDEAVPHESLADVWTYTCKKSGDRLHAYDIDYSKVADYYKGDPNGGYQSYVFTDHLGATEIVRLRDQVESEVRAELGIPFNPGAPGVKYEHSMGAGNINQLPAHILRTTT